MLISYELMLENDKEGLWDNVLGTASLSLLMTQLWNQTIDPEIVRELYSDEEHEIVKEVSSKAIKYYKNSTQKNLQKVLLSMKKLAKYHNLGVGFVDINGIAFIVESQHDDNYHWPINEPNGNHRFDLMYKHGKVFFITEKESIEINQDNYVPTLYAAYPSENPRTLYLYFEAVIRGFMLLNNKIKVINVQH